MFTGIVQDVGRVQTSEPRGGDLRLLIACTRLDMSALRVGDSVCVQGCCLTATEVQRRTFSADISRETLELTTLGELGPGAPVNLEPALGPGMRSAVTWCRGTSTGWPGSWRRAAMRARGA